MDEKNLVESFREWTKGGIELVKPWKLALILTNLFWAVVLFAFIWMAYMTPVDVNQNQNQDFSNSAQTQTNNSTGGGK